MDLLARLGGDEFALLFAECAPGEAEAVIERLRAGMPSPHSCSVGLAAWNGSELAEDLMKRSDAALYETKRNRYGLATANPTAGREGDRRPNSIP